MSFNPRARTGRDPLCPVVLSTAIAFQSTRPHGARPSPDVRVILAPLCFNPRARTGRDRRERHAFIQVNRVSIHAPARGATTTT